MQLGSSHAQMKFFITPNFNFKTAIAFVDPASLNTSENHLFENQMFYMPYAVSESARVIKHPAFNMGLGIAMSYKNDTRMIQFLWSQDVARFRTRSSFRSYSANTYSGYGISYYGIKLNRLTVNYSHKISKKETVIRPWFSFGLGAFINTNGFTDVFASDWNMPLAPNGDILLRTYLQPFEEKRVNAFIKVGIENDLYLFKKYFFSVNAYFIQGFGKISRVEYVHEYLFNNELVFNRIGLMSRGSGFYWEVSRRFQVFPIKKTKNKMAE